MRTFSIAFIVSFKLLRRLLLKFSMIIITLITIAIVFCYGQLFFWFVLHVSSNSSNPKSEVRCLIIMTRAYLRLCRIKVND